MCYHRVGDPQALDVLVFDSPTERETVFSVDVSDDDRWVVVAGSRGSSEKSEVHLIDRSTAGAPVPLFTGFTSAYSFIQEAGGRLYFHTDHEAPRGRIVSVDPLRRDRAPTEIVAESADKLSAAMIVHHSIVAAYLHDASDRVRLFGLDGVDLGSIALPGIGSLAGMTGRPGDRELFLGFTSFTDPPTNYRYDFTAGTLTPSPIGPPGMGQAALAREGGNDTDEAANAAPPVRGFRLQPEESSASAIESPVDPDAYETSQVWYTSKDGTKVSMFLVHRKGLERDGQRPVLLSGYGGFNVCLTPGFDPSNFILLDAGGIYAVANLRGGGEYGEAWHEAGTFERKQNVFDDFIAAAEWLTASGWSRADKIAIEGGSNGGLLTGAVMIQRPDLFGAVVCRVPVADMLRYHLFTVGRFWISEYGSADSPDQFPYLLAYSPYHNVKDGAAYPPILITTADTDDRVSPGMAKKFAARLQAAAGARSVVLIRVETKAGHGAGKPVSKLIEEDADIFSFLFTFLGVES